MAEAKYGLKFLFSNIAEVHKEKVQVQNKLTEMQDALDDVSDFLFIFIQLLVCNVCVFLRVPEHAIV